MDNMLDRILDRIIEVYGNNVDILNMAKEKAISFLQASQLPERYLGGTYIDINKNSIVRKILDGLDIYLFSDKSSVLYLDTYKYSGYIIGCVLSKYIEQRILSDSYAGNIMFIDTLLLLDDYKKLIAKTSEIGIPKTYYDIDVLFNGIYEAEYIFWDKFTEINTEYEFSKITEIITHRYNKCKSNMYIVTGDTTNTIFDKYPHLLMETLNIGYAYNLSDGKISLTEGEVNNGN